MKLGIRSTAAIVLATAGLSAVGAAEARAQESLRVVTLDEAIEQALSSDPAAVAAAGAETSARAQLRQAWGSYLPTITLNSSYGNSSNQRFDQATGRLVSESYTAQITAGYDLFTGGRRLLQQRAARVRFDWPDAAQVFAKLDEELGEIHEEIAKGGDPDRLEGRLEGRARRARCCGPRRGAGVGRGPGSAPERRGRPGRGGPAGGDGQLGGQARPTDRAQRRRGRPASGADRVGREQRRHRPARSPAGRPPGRPRPSYRCRPPGERGRPP